MKKTIDPRCSSAHCSGTRPHNGQASDLARDSGVYLGGFDDPARLQRAFLLVPEYLAAKEKLATAVLEGTASR